MIRRSLGGIGVNGSIPAAYAIALETVIDGSIAVEFVAKEGV